MHGGMRNLCKLLVRKHEGKRPLRRPRHTCKDNNRMDPKEIRWEVVNWMHLIQDRDHWWALVYMIMNLWVP
jgi:hypothetical protein